MKKSLLLPGILSLMTAPAFAASVSYNFESSAVDTYFTSNGVAGWTQTPNTNPVTSVTNVVKPMAFIDTAPFEKPGGLVTSNAAYLGTLLGNFSTNITTTLQGSLVDVGNISGSRLSLDFGILSDTEANFATRDIFGFNITDALGSSIASIILTPDAADFSVWNLSYTTGTEGAETTLSTVTMGSAYTLFLSFTDDTIRMTYGRSSTGLQEYLIAEVTTTAAAGASYGNLEVFHNPQGDPGDSSNAIIFDNIAAVPEPTSASLLAAFGALGLMRRRRNS